MSGDEVTLPSPYHTLLDEKPKQKQKVHDTDPTSCGLLCCLASLWNGLKKIGKCLMSVLCYCIFWGQESGCSGDGDDGSKYGGGDGDDDIPLPAPLINLGNTCYFNVIVQAINYTKEFHDMCKSSRTYTLKSKTGEKLKIPVFQLGAINRELHNLLSKMSQSGRMSINPGGLLSKINESGDGKVFDANQQDAHELLRHLLQHLKNEEIKIIQNEVRNYNESPLSEGLMSEYIRAANRGVTLIDRNIGGKCVNTIICRECLKPVQLTEPFFDISLSIPDQSTKNEKRNEIPLMTRRHVAISDTDSHAINTDINSAGGSDRQTVVTASDLRSPPILEAHINPKVATEFTTLQQYLHNEGLHYHPPSPARLPSALGLEQSLHNYTDVDVLDDDNRFICNSCNRNNCLVSKQTMILQLHNVLILHIKRFNIGDIAVTKNNKFLSFSQLLDIAPYCSDKCLQRLKDKNDQILYGLYAVVVHRGRRLRSGHYVAYVRVRPNRSKVPPLPQDSEYEKSASHDRVPQGFEYDERAAYDGVWCYTSDQTINKCSRGFEDVKSQHAYLLFYEKLPTK
ncbi:ubiquitin carboxyl-terminal hydrolase 16-like isoform X2 [Dysidea avara]|uniref:ubiquitin carboxyl-terminal hydrolase 16-like isoform X2 n=1 Tax=Dysidea avara TaxID=196820 RepID=UPI003316AF69